MQSSELFNNATALTCPTHPPLVLSSGSVFWLTTKSWWECWVAWPRTFLTRSMMPACYTLPAGKLTTTLCMYVQSNEKLPQACQIQCVIRYVDGSGSVDVHSLVKLNVYFGWFSLATILTVYGHCEMLRKWMCKLCCVSWLQQFFPNSLHCSGPLCLHYWFNLDVGSISVDVITNFAQTTATH